MSDPFLASYVLLWALLLAGLVVTLGNTRQVALLVRRFPPEVRDEPGPKFGRPVPPVKARTLEGDDVTVGPTFPAQTLLLFMEDGCTVCTQVLPKVGQLVDEAPDLAFWMVFEREPLKGSELVNGFRSRVLVAPKLFDKWKVRTVPFACVVTPEGKLESKGGLAGEVGRLRESLGLPPETNLEAQEQEEIRAYDTAGHKA